MYKNKHDLIRYCTWGPTGKINQSMLMGIYPPLFLPKIPEVDVKMGGGRQGKKKDFSHIHIF